MKGWWGKFLGAVFGFWWLGFLGLLVGVFLGHALDRAYIKTKGSSTADVRAAFFKALFLTMGYVAKSDGQVTNTELEVARSIMSYLSLTDEQRLTAMRLFNQGKSPDFDLYLSLQEFKQVCFWRRNMLYMYLQLIFKAACADGPLSRTKQELLLTISKHLGISQLEFLRLYQMFLAQNSFGSGRGSQGSSGFVPGMRKDELKNAYAILGLKNGEAFDEVKKTYRRLMNQYHPDKLSAKGLPDNLMKAANEKVQMIQSAYDLIKTRTGN